MIPTMQLESHTPSELEDAITYRMPMRVTEVRLYRSDGVYPVCPRCDISLDREYMRYCDRCGQCLSWRSYKECGIRRIPIE